MLIIRNELEDSLYNFINSGNGIIIGPPGIGKTHLLKKICSRLKKEQIPCLYLPIDKFCIENNHDLESSLQFKGDFIDELYHHPEVTKKKGFFLIDSFDSARSEKSKKFFLNLIERAEKQLCGKWQIIVSVRTFDAKKSQKLLELFPELATEEKTESHSHEIHCRHFFIPKLTDDELKSALDGKNSSANILRVSNTEIWDLLKIPFNLWLFEQIFALDQSIIELEKIGSQVELLDLFWKRRVHDTPLWEEKEIILRSATQKMVESKKLFVNIENIYQSDKKEALHSLLSDQIIMETSQNSSSYAFSHNILFDYAVSVLLIDESEHSFFSFISKDISRQLFLRPSLDFYFTHLWHFNSQQFWKIFWKILGSNEINLNILIRLTSVNVLLAEVKHIDEINPIFSEIERGNHDGKKAILYILQALEVQGFKNEGLWLDFLNRISAYMDKFFIWNFGWVLSKIIDNSIKQNNHENLQYCGKIGRNLLSWVLKERTKEKSDFIDGLGANWAVPIVAKTFSTDPINSKSLLKEILAIRLEPNFLIMYVYRLVEELENIWLIDPEFVEEIYITVFSYEETSQEKISMGTPVLPLSSTRRQDYEMCYYILVKKYPKFLSECSLVAAKTAINTLNQYIIQHHIIPFINPGYRLEDLSEKYVLKNKSISIYSDHCIVWDTSGYTEEPIKIATELFNFIEKKVHDKEFEILDDLIDIFIDNVKVTFFWRRLLISATKYPEVFSEKIFDFCIAKPFLSGSETIKEMGDFIQKASPFFSSEQLAKIESAILEIPNEDITNDTDKYEYLVSKRDRLLVKIPKDLLQTKEGIAIRISMEMSETIPDNEPIIKWDSGTRIYSEEDSLKDSGVDISIPANKELFQSFNSLEQFSSTWQNKQPDVEAVQKILPELKKVYTLLEDNSVADIKIKNNAWTHLAACVSIISKRIEPSDIDTFAFCKEVLLKCARHPEPVFNPKYHSTFESLAWSPDPRTEAAMGLPKLGHNIRDQEILSEVKKLAIDDLVPVVRYLTISRLLFLMKTSPDFVWDLTTEIVQKERVPNILFATCNNIGRIFNVNPKKAEYLLELVFETTDVIKYPDRSNTFIPIIVQLSVIYKNEWATRLLTDIIIEDPKTYSKQFGFIVFEISRLFDSIMVDEVQKRDEVSDRAIEMLDKLLTATQSRISKIASSIDKTKEIKIDSEINELYLVIHEVILRIFFAIKKDDTKSDNSNLSISNKKRERLYFQFKPLLDKIIKFQDFENTPSFNAQTLHYFVQIFNEVVEFDPEYVIHMMADLVSQGDRSYSFDPLASNEILKFGEKIVGDHKDVLQNDEVLKEFISIVEVFARNGDKKMIQFVWRLDEIYR
jgi:hypothetical protein